MKMDVAPLGPFNVACIRHVGPYMNVGPIFDELWAWAVERGVAPGPSAMMGFSYDNPDTVPAEQLRYDVCVPVPYGTKGDGVRVLVQEFPEVEYAQTTHVGPYSGLKASFDALYKRAFEDDLYTLAEGPCIEIYIDDPSTTPEAECRTRIGMPAQRM